MSLDSLDDELFEQRTRDACRELERRVRTGMYHASESVLADNPDLADRGEFALELIYTEFVTLDELGRRPDPAELYDRFPAWQDRLRRLLSVHDLFGVDGPGEEVGIDEATETARDPAPTRGSSSVSSVECLADHPRRIGPYEVLEEIGRGGMGIVYRARHLELDRIVALKMISPSQNDRNHRLRFRREAESAARLQHPNIVQVYEVGEENGVSYLAMEYVAGGSLEERLNGPPLSERQAVELTATLAKAMQVAHDLGVVHRDLKPGNVLLQDKAKEVPAGDVHGSRTAHTAPAMQTPATSSSSACITREPALMPKISDFGLAKRSWEHAQQKTRTGAILGTPAYMAPEQATGSAGDVGPAADVYALGAILYESLTGRPPFHAISLLETLEQVRVQEPIPPTRLRPSISRDIETICLKCLEKRPSARYASADALADDLDRFLSGRPITARPTGPVERTYKWAKRRPALASLTAAVLCVAAIGFAAVVWQWRQVEKQHAAIQNALNAVQSARRDEQRQREKLSASAYFHKISLAHREFIDGDLARATQLFEDSRDDPHRGWEYDYLDRMLHQQRRPLTGHRLLVYGLDFSPDGKLLASSSAAWGRNDRGQVILWDVESGRPRFQLHGHPAAIMSVAFSPDGRQLASAGGHWSKEGPGQVKIWDTSSGEELASLESQADLLMSVAYAPQGDLIAAAGDRFVELWEMPGGEPVALLKGHRQGVFEVTFSPDGKYLASASVDRTVRVWDLARRKCIHVLKTDCTQRSVCFSPDGRFLAAGGWFGMIRLWDVNDDFQEIANHPSYEGAVLRVRFTPDAQFLAAATNRGVIRLIDPLTGKEHSTLRGHRDDASCIAVSPDTVLLASGGTDRFINLWDLADSENPVVIPFNNHVGELAFSPDGNRLAVAAKKNTASLGTGEKVVAILDLPGRKIEKQLRGHTDWLTSVAFHQDGQHIVTGSHDKTARIWNVKTGETVKQLTGHSDTVSDVALSFSGDYVLTSSRDKTIKLWDMASGKLIATWQGHTAAVTSIAFHPDDQIALSAGEDGSAIVWEVPSGKRLATIRNRCALSEAIFSPDGRYIATAGDDHQVVLWKLTRDEDGVASVARKHVLHGHAQPVMSIAFAPDSRRLASAEAVSIKLWDVESGYEALSLDRHDRSPFDLAFSPDGKRLASGNVAIWSIKDWAVDDALQKELTLRRHRTHVNQCKAARNWYGVAFHLSHLIEIQPESDGYLRQRARAYAEQGLWDQAESDLLNALEMSPGDLAAAYCTALLYIRRDHLGGYRQLCQSLIDSYGNSHDARTANAIAWDCALTPAAVSDYRRVLELSEHAVASCAADKKHIYLNTYGALLYRAGQLETAADALLGGIQAHGNGGEPLDWIILAMVQQRLGHKEEALEWYEKALHEWDAPIDSQDDPLSAWDRIEVQLFCQEAERVLGLMSPFVPRK